MFISYQIMDLLHSFQQYISKEHIFGMNDRLLLAVSGGVDSVVLCSLCKESGFEFGIAHCNYQLRGEESLRDERFVEDLARKYDVPFFLKRFETHSRCNKNKTGIQETARNYAMSGLRHCSGNRLICHQRKDTQGFSCVVTAHPANDISKPI